MSNCSYYVTKIAELISNIIISIIKLNIFVFTICNRWFLANCAFETVLHIVQTLFKLPLSLFHCSCTQWAQLLQKMELKPTPLQQAPHGCLPDVNFGSWFTYLIITSVSLKFTLSPLLSIQFFYAAYLASSSSKLPVIIIKSLAYNIAQGRLFLHFLERLSSTIINNRGLKQIPDQLLPLPQIYLPQHC